MLLTNLILIAAVIAMIAGFIWLFRDGDAGGVRPTIIPLDSDSDDAAVSVVRVTVVEPAAPISEDKPAV